MTKNIIITTLLILPLMVISCNKDEPQPLPLPCICEGEFVYEHINDSLEIIILNSFTPNNDGINDLWGGHLIGHGYYGNEGFNDDSIYLYIQNYSISINGIVVNDNNQGWDGGHIESFGWDGGDYPSGNYEYLISFMWENESYNYEGVVSLVDSYDDNLENYFSCYTEEIVMSRCEDVQGDPGYFE